MCKHQDCAYVNKQKCLQAVIFVMPAIHFYQCVFKQAVLVIIMPQTTTIHINR